MKDIKRQSEAAKKIYERNLGLNLESASGVGSTKEVTKEFRGWLSAVIKKHRISSIVDMPCGDFNWMQLVALDGIDYLGLDIVPEIIESNSKRFPHLKFQHFNAITTVPPKADLIIVRDFLFHLTTEQSITVIENIYRSKTPLLAITTFSEKLPNSDLSASEKEYGWGFRRLNMEEPPFSLSNPISAVQENRASPDGRRYVKLYRINPSTGRASSR